MYKNTINKFSIFFGNEKSNIFAPNEVYSTIDNFPDQTLINLENKFNQLNDNSNLKDIFLLRQTHSVDGFILKDTFKVKAFHQNGDYIISNIKNLGIGILTADCLPIIFYDTKNNIIAIAHAGWPGTVNGISKKVITDLKENFNSRIEDIEIYFGPSAKKCCYEVNYDFTLKLDLNLKKETIIKTNSKLYFDLPLYNILTLNILGIPDKKINLNYNNCTICNLQYCSYRRQKDLSGRQMTIIGLY